MSFLKSTFDVIKNITTILTNTAAEQANKIREMEKEFEQYSDEQLFNILKSSSTIRKSIARKLLLRRGYSSSQINERM